MRTENAPYHLNLAAVLPGRTRAIEEAGQVVFHAVGDTGGISGRGAQENVADPMTRQVQSTRLPGQPSFLYHFGDVVYYTGEDTKYHEQFYHPYPVRCQPKTYPCPTCGRHGRLERRLERRVRSLAYGQVVWLHVC